MKSSRIAVIKNYHPVRPSTNYNVICDTSKTKCGLTAAISTWLVACLSCKSGAYQISDLTTVARGRLGALALSLVWIVDNNQSVASVEERKTGNLALRFTTASRNCEPGMPFSRNILLRIKVPFV